MDTSHELQSGLGLATGLGLIQLLIQLPHKTTRQHPRYLALSMGYSTSHRSVCTSTPKCLHLLTEVPCTPHRGGAHHTPHRGAPQSTSLCELSWLHLSSLVRTTGENTATDQIESKRDSLRCRRALRVALASRSRPSLYSFSKLTWSPSSELLYGHPALVAASLVFGQTSVHIPKHLPALLYHSGSSKYRCTCFAYLCATVTFPCPLFSLIPLDPCRTVAPPVWTFPPNRADWDADWAPHGARLPPGAWPASLSGACRRVKLPLGAWPRLLARGYACSLLLGACGRVGPPPCAWQRVGPPWGAWLRLISLADLQTAREGVSGLCFRRDLVLELRIDKRKQPV
ncbi:hypothetical protein Acr_00g0082910 [Actinidia rufa]|uniref:Uncharacterized protein n=1 Tax=Actinidia rufa TaxID=165716 RepID=A0A7J0DW10_9ERIC|nr:hypothetical protein Acr_00g0082910 [Actinidia rufa]